MLAYCINQSRQETDGTLKVGNLKRIKKRNGIQIMGNLHRKVTRHSAVTGLVTIWNITTLGLKGKKERGHWNLECEESHVI